MSETDNSSELPESWRLSISSDKWAGEKILVLSRDDLTSELGVVVGRKPENPEYAIEHDTISRQHARFILDHQGNLCLVDLGSTNGTMLNRKRLKPNEAVPLSPDSQIEFASLPATLTFPEPKHEPPPQAAKHDNKTGPEEDGQTIMMDLADAHDPIVNLDSDGVPIKQEAKDTPSEKLIATILTFGSTRPLIAAGLTIILTAIAIIGALSLQIDTSYDSMFSRKDPDYPAYTKVIGEFGSDNISIIYLKDANLFSKDRLLAIEDLTFGLQDLEFVESSDSLFTSLNIRDQGGALDLNPLMDTVPETAKEIASVKDNALYSPLIRRNYLSEDGQTTAIVVTVKSVEQDPEYNRRVFAKIETLIEPNRGLFDEIFQVGPPRLNVEIERGMFSDMTIISPIATIVLVICIVLFLRTTIAAALPLATAGLSILWTMGFMGYFGIPLNLLTAILPALVIVIGSTEDTHMLSSYLDGLPQKPPIRRDDAIRFMAVHVGLPIFITSFTTTVGFLSNTISDISLIADFGLATSFAMTANLVVTILVLPFMLHYFGPTKSGISDDSGKRSKPVEITLNFLERVIERHGTIVMGATMALFVVGFGFATQVQVSNDPLSYFRSDNRIRVDAVKLHEDLAGMQVFYLTVEAEPNKDFKDPDQLAKVAKVQRFMDTQGVYDKVISIADYMVLVNREMHQGDKAYYRIPETRELMEQYLLLFQRSDIERYINSDQTRINMLVRHNISDSWELNKYLAELDAKAAEVFGKTMTYSLTGKNLMINRAAETLFSSQVLSLGLLIGIIFIIMTALYTSITAGFLSLIPNLVPIAALFGVMGIFGIPLNPGTAIVAVIAVGIAIDDTIHLLSTYNNECRKDPDQNLATQRAVRTEAIPVISTSLSLAAGFSVLYFSRFNIVAQFGTLSAFTLLVAMMTDLLITPIFMRRLRLVGVWDVISIRIGKETLTLSPLFQGMSNFQIRKTICLSHIVEYQPGEQVFSQGELGSDLYVVLSGFGEIVHSDGRHRKIIAQCGPGEVVGEAGYAGGTRRMATFRSSKGDNLCVLRLNAREVSDTMRLYPWLHAKLNKNINAILALHLSRTGEKLVHESSPRTA